MLLEQALAENKLLITKWDKKEGLQSPSAENINDFTSGNQTRGYDFHFQNQLETIEANKSDTI